MTITEKNIKQYKERFYVDCGEKCVFSNSQKKLINKTAEQEADLVYMVEAYDLTRRIFVPEKTIYANNRDEVDMVLSYIAAHIFDMIVQMCGDEAIVAGNPYEMWKDTMGIYRIVPMLRKNDHRVRSEPIKLMDYLDRDKNKSFDSSKDTKLKQKNYT